MNVPFDESVADEPPKSWFGMLHDDCLTAIETLADFANGRFGDPAASADDARDVLRVLRDLGDIACGAASIVERIGDELRKQGHARRWEVEIADRIEPGAHLALVRFLEVHFVRSLHAIAVNGWHGNDGSPETRGAEPAPDELSDADALAYFRGDGVALPLVRAASVASEKHARLRFLLEREAIDLRDALPIHKSNAGAADAGTVDQRTSGPVVSVDLHHRLRRVERINGGSGSIRLTRAQMDFVLLCALARKKDAWYRTADFQKLAGLGNPSGLFDRLPAPIKALIESGKLGRRLACDANIVDPAELAGGRSIDWKRLAIVERGQPDRHAR